MSGWVHDRELAQPRIRPGRWPAFEERYCTCFFARICIPKPRKVWNYCRAKPIRRSQIKRLFAARKPLSRALFLPRQSRSSLPYPPRIREIVAGITIPIHQCFSSGNTSTRKYLCDSPPPEIINIFPPVYCIIRFRASASAGPSQYNGIKGKQDGRQTNKFLPSSLFLFLETITY